MVRALPLDRILLETGALAAAPPPCGPAPASPPSWPPTDAPWCGIRRTHAGHGHIKSTWPAVKPEKVGPGACAKNRCEPCHLVQVLEVVAAIEGVDEETLAQQVWRNTSALFALGEA